MPQDGDDHDGIFVRALARPDVIAALIIIAANACLWWLGIRQRALPFVLFLWTLPLNGALLIAGLFATALLRRNSRRIFDWYMKWIVFGPLVATAVNVLFLILGLLAAEPWRPRHTVGP